MRVTGIETPARPSFLQSRALVISVSLLVALLAESLVLVFLGPPSGDEGWSLAAAKAVSQGKVLYRDFIYTQTPFLPYVYAPSQGVTGGDIYLGRLTSTVFVLLTGVGVALLARKAYGVATVPVSLGLLLFSPLAVYYMTLVLPYALVAFCLVFAYVALTSDLPKGIKYPLAGLLIALASAAKFNSVFAILAVLLFILLRERWGFRYIALTVLALIAFLGLLLGPFVWLAPQAFFADVFEYHYAQKVAEASVLLARKLDFAVRVVGQSAPVLGIILGGAFYWLRSGGFRALRGGRASVPLALSLSLGFLLAVSFVANLGLYSPVNIQYTGVLPLAYVLAGGLLVGGFGILQRANVPKHLGQSVLAGLAAFFVMSSMFRGGGIVISEGRVTAEISSIREVGRFVREHVGPGELLFSYFPLVALEAKRDVLPGMESGGVARWSTRDTEWVRSIHGMNDELEVEHLRSRKAKAIVLDTPFHEHLKDAIPPEYKLVLTKSVPSAYDTVYVYLRQD